MNLFQKPFNLVTCPMHRNTRLSLFFVPALLLVGAGCAKKPAAAAPVPVSTADADRARQDSTDRANAAQRAAEESTRLERERVAQEAAAVKEQARQSLTAAIFFDFDKSDLTDDAQRLLDAKVELLKLHSDVSIRIEGNADDSGSDEYNMALGQRRASMAARYLTDRGVNAGRIQITSVGEERPLCTTGQDEPCRQQNRRDDFAITAGL